MVAPLASGHNRRWALSASAAAAGTGAAVAVKVKAGGRVAIYAAGNTSTAVRVNN